jgi:hypothetical protein
MIFWSGAGDYSTLPRSAVVGYAGQAVKAHLVLRLHSWSIWTSPVAPEHQKMLRMADDRPVFVNQGKQLLAVRKTVEAGGNVGMHLGIAMQNHPPEAAPKFQNKQLQALEKVV